MLRRIVILSALLVICVSLASCRQNAEPKSISPEVQEQLTRALEQVKTTLDGADRLEITLLEFHPKFGEGRRVGPFVTNDPKLIYALQQALAKPQLLDINPGPHVDTMSGAFLEIEIVNRATSTSEHIRMLGPEWIALRQDERSRAWIDGDPIWRRVRELAEAEEFIPWKEPS